MSIEMSSAVGSRETAQARMRRFGFVFFTFFVVTLVIGVVVVLALFAFACTWNPHVRCFSIPRDMLGLISSAAEMWFMLALVVAFLAAVVAQISRAAAWWSALVVVPVSILTVGMFPIGAASLAREAISDPLLFLGVGLVFLAAHQLSLFVSKQVGKLPT